MNKLSESTIKLLNKSLQKAIENAAKAKANNEDRKWAIWERKKEYINNQIKYFTRLKNGAEPPKRVFISYTKAKGSEYHQLLKEKLEAEGFTVTDGFNHDPSSRGNVLRNILNQLENSSLYVGIFTKESEIKINGKEFWAPSVWTIEEKGMALGLRKPVLLLVENLIHDDFYRKTTGAFHAFKFNNYEHFKGEIIENVLLHLSIRYHDLIKKSVDINLDVF